MLRLIFTLFISVTVARWFYSETKLMIPGALPIIDALLHATQIPTHDKWPKHSLEQIYSFVGAVTREAVVLASSEERNEDENSKLSFNTPRTKSSS